MPSLVVTRCHVLEAGAWGIWSADDEVTPAICGLAATPATVDIIIIYLFGIAPHP